MNFDQIAVVDVGSPANIGWAIESFGQEQTGTRIDDLIVHLRQALDRAPVALGFEAPMFTPIHADAGSLTRARPEEFGSGRYWSAGAGPVVLAQGIVTAHYVLQSLHSQAPHTAAVTMDHTRLLEEPWHLLLFEAFVYGQHHDNEDPQRHIQDAQSALYRFRSIMHNPSEVLTERCLNLLGASLLHIGWTKDLEILRRPCLVVRVDPPPHRIF